ncbi:hypothetical protein BpHYR1_042281 [Brachionus plicatilis]|uniref:Uncharacterized protein n=1 Tax=Brachionus plicatilis TaxID=10195 RepID=A0A3M7R501_BRAPC|nr:hypothetical protein BpHYR1_042281 [Brachionus plicatilis]
MYSHYLPERLSVMSNRSSPYRSPGYSYYDDRIDHYVERINQNYYEVTRPHSSNDRASVKIRKNGDFYMTSRASSNDKMKFFLLMFHVTNISDLLPTRAGK